MSARELTDADIRAQQSREHELRQKREAGTDPDRRTNFQTLLHKRAQTWDWVDITTDLSDTMSPRARVFVHKIGYRGITIGLEISGGAQGYTVSGEFVPTRTPIEPGEDGQCLIEVERYLNGGWDGIQIDFGGTNVDVIISRAWYRKLALAVKAPRSITIRKTVAPG